MTRVLRLIALIFGLTCTLGSMGQAADISIGMAENHIDITTGFQGDKLIIFGMQKTDGDFAIVLEGPAKEMRVRRKEKTSGIWMNRTNVKFENVPSFYKLAVSDPERVPPILAANNITIDQRVFDVADKDVKEKEKRIFQKALIRNKQKQDIYTMEAQTIEYLEDDFFRTSFYIPANVSTGNFKVKTYKITDDDNAYLIRSDILKVEQVGNGAEIYSFSKRYGLFYGLMCVMLAASIGFLSNVIRNRLN